MSTCSLSIRDTAATILALALLALVGANAGPQTLHAPSQRERARARERERQTDRQTRKRHTDTESDRPRDRQTDRQRNVVNKPQVAVVNESHVPVRRLDVGCSVPKSHLELDLSACLCVATGCSNIPPRRRESIKSMYDAAVLT